MSVVLRGKTFQLLRRVPARYCCIEPRKELWISLHTDSESVARSKSERAWQHLIEGWEALLAGSTDDATARHAAAVELARIRGFRYLDVEDVAKLPIPELVGRNLGKMVSGTACGEHISWNITRGRGIS